MLERPDLPLFLSAEEESFDPTPPPSPEGQVEEEMVPDVRAALTPAQVVERKVITLLKGGSLPLRCTVAEFSGGPARRPPGFAA